MKPHLTQKWSSFILTHILNGLKMAIYDPKNAIFVTDLIGMALKSFKVMQKLYETTPNTEIIFIWLLNHILNGLKMVI